jgi:hypothetical protein
MLLVRLFPFFVIDGMLTLLSICFALCRPEGPMLTYARDDSPSAPAKMIELSSTSRCIVRPKLSRDHEFRVITSTDSSRREFALAAVSNFDLTEWVCSIQSAINAGNKSTFEGEAAQSIME